jgi:hypothetical protein
LGTFLSTTLEASFQNEQNSSCSNLQYRVTDGWAFCKVEVVDVGGRLEHHILPEEGDEWNPATIYAATFTNSKKRIYIQLHLYFILNEKITTLFLLK